MVFALGAFLLSSGAGPTSQPALADVDSISVNTIAGEDGDHITVTVEAEDDSGDNLVISVASGQGTLTIDDCEVDGYTIAEDVDGCKDDDGTDDDEVTITAVDSETLDDNTDDSDSTSEALTVTLNLELDCRDGTIEVVTITADQGTSESITVVCGFDAPNITIEKEADGDNDTFDFDFDVSSGEDCAVFKHDVLVDEGGGGDFSLDDNEEVELYCDDDAVVEIVETDDGEFSEIEDDDDCRESDSWIEFDGASVTIDLDEANADDDGTVTCNFRNEGGLTPTATSTPIGAGPPSTVTVSAAPDSLPDCGGSSFVAVVVKSASGAYVSDGTVVSISANLGSVSPSTTTTLGGGVLGRYIAPTNAGGTATITATSGSRSGSDQIELLCLTATATPLPTQVPPVIQPPSTGDAGLVANGSGWTGYAGILLIAAALLGTAAVAPKRA